MWYHQNVLNKADCASIVSLASGTKLVIKKKMDSSKGMKIVLSSILYVVFSSSSSKFHEITIPLVCNSHIIWP
jgi:hypothetical protein